MPIPWSCVACSTSSPAIPEVAATGVKTVLAGYFDVAAPATEADVALLRRKGAAFLKAYRDSGAGDIAVGPPSGSRSAWV